MKNISCFIKGIGLTVFMLFISIAHASALQPGVNGLDIGDPAYHPLPSVGTTQQYAYIGGNTVAVGIVAVVAEPSLELIGTQNVITVNAETAGIVAAVDDVGIFTAIGQTDAATGLYDAKYTIVQTAAYTAIDDVGAAAVKFDPGIAGILLIG